MGTAAGVIASLVVARLIASLLFGTEPTDPLTFAGMAIVLATVALVLAISRPGELRALTQWSL